MAKKIKTSNKYKSSNKNSSKTSRDNSRDKDDNKKSYKKFDNKKPKGNKFKNQNYQTFKQGEQVEGIHSVYALLQSNRVVEKLFVDESKNNPEVANIVGLAKKKNIQIIFLNSHQLQQKSASFAPQGVVAIAQPLQLVDGSNVFDKKQMVVACDGITDPQNLGSIIRTSLAVDCGVVLPKQRSAALSPSVMKVSAGASEVVPISICSGLGNWLTNVKKQGVFIVGCDYPSDISIFDFVASELASESKSEVSNNRWKSQNIVVVVGAEGKGISQSVKQKCDVVVHIPMNKNTQLSGVDSLNVSVAFGVVAYQVAQLIR